MPRYHRTPEERIAVAAQLAYETWRDEGPQTPARLDQLAAVYAIGWDADLGAVTLRAHQLHDEEA